MVTATGPIPPLSGLPSAAPADAIQTAAPLQSVVEPEGPDVAELSQLGALLQRLTDLQLTNPDQAQHALLAMASELSARAAQSGGDPQLSALANAFVHAAQTGDLSQVHPPGPPRGDESIEGTAPNTSTAQGQAASYALGEPPARPGLESLLENTLPRTEPEQRTVLEAPARVPQRVL